MRSLDPSLKWRRASVRSRVREASGKVDLAAGKPACATSEFIKNKNSLLKRKIVRLAANAVDGDPRTRWVADRRLCAN
jgi:hypothetical protein